MIWINVRKELKEWIDAGCSTGLFMNAKRGDWEKPYQRFCGSKVGYFLHILGYNIGWHTSIIFDPLHSGSFLSHMRSFLWNLWHCDIWWPITHRIDRWRRPKFHRQQDVFFRATTQAMVEGFSDPMLPPDGFPAEQFHGTMLGERYFKRVAEIIKENEEQD